MTRIQKHKKTSTGINFKEKRCRIVEYVYNEIK